MEDQEELPRCKAHSRSGERCKRRPIPGGTVCHFHGGKAPQVKKKAQIRLLELVDPAIATMAKIMVAPDSKDADRLRAVENILDRAGVPRTATLPEPTVAIDMVLTHIRERRAEIEE